MNEGPDEPKKCVSLVLEVWFARARMFAGERVSRELLGKRIMGGFSGRVALGRRNPNR